MIERQDSHLTIGQHMLQHVDIRLVDRCDVIVAGAGVAGLAAALTAARSGADVMLIEPKNFVGGHAAMGLPMLGTHTITGIRATAGIVEEFLSRLKEMRAATDVVRDARVCSFAILDPAGVKLTALKMLQEAGVRVLLHSKVTDAICHGRTVLGVVVDGIKGLIGKVVIDATGDGTVAALVGAPWELGEGNTGLLQPATLVFRMGNVDVQRGHTALLEMGHQIYHEDFIASLGVPLSVFAPWGSQHFIVNAFRKEVQDAIEVGDLSADYPQQRVIWWNAIAPNEAFVLMAKVTGYNGSETEQMSAAEQKSLSMVPGLIAFMRKYIPGFEHAHLIEMAPQIGIRETRRILGDYVLNERDILEGAYFEDSVGLGAYYLDVHPPQGGDKTVESMQYPLEPFQIPYRCLVPRGVEGILVAGRCSSVTSRAFGATRVISCCMVQGQAAGAASAICADLNCPPRQVPSGALQSLLRSQGVFLYPEDTDDKLCLAEASEHHSRVMND